MLRKKRELAKPNIYWQLTEATNDHVETPALVGNPQRISDESQAKIRRNSKAVLVVLFPPGRTEDSIYPPEISYWS